jgi:hypothetical protein
MRSTRFFATSLLLFAAFTTFSQNHTDCATSIFRCEKTGFTITYSGGIGMSDGIEGTCLNEEFASTWFRWKIAQPGDLIFLLTPTNGSDDLDFAVFKLNSTGDCDSKTLVRCMAAGETVGDPTGSLPCLGSTGLAFGETDVTENPGCSNGNNNFLAPLNCLAGEEYVLLVNNFSQSNGGFTLTLGGDAGLSCDSTSTAAKEAATPDLLQLYPNPADELLQMVLPGNQGLVHYRVTDSVGRLVEAGEFTGEYHQIMLTGWRSGVYALTLKQGDAMRVRRLVIAGSRH